MKSFILSTLLFTNAYAGIEPGIWRGIINDYSSCFMEVGASTMKNDVANPLNERISIKVGAINYSVKHPYTINTENGAVSFNQDLYEDVVPTDAGAYALRIKVMNSDFASKPDSLSVMEDNWKLGKKEVINCHDLKKVD